MYTKIPLNFKSIQETNTDNSQSPITIRSRSSRFNNNNKNSNLINNVKPMRNIFNMPPARALPKFRPSKNTQRWNKGASIYNSSTRNKPTRDFKDSAFYNNYPLIDKTYAEKEHKQTLDETSNVINQISSKIKQDDKLTKVLEKVENTCHVQEPLNVQYNGQSLETIPVLIGPGGEMHKTDSEIPDFIIKFAPDTKNIIPTFCKVDVKKKNDLEIALQVMYALADLKGIENLKEFTELYDNERLQLLKFLKFAPSSNTNKTI
jgi:hypothetical protein